MGRHYHIIQREASALLFLLQWAMREPRKAERATDTGFHAFSFIHHQSDFGRPIGHDRIIMKENQTEELQSRRSFFKNAAKAALPILGAIALANMPIIAKASETPSGCTGTCYGACYGSCKGCSTTCTGTCSNACTGCSTTCTGTCSGSCKHSCTYANR